MTAYSPHTSARRTDPGTSEHAAHAATSFAGTQCDRIRAALALHGPMDPEQLGAVVGIEPYAARKRLADLKRVGQADTTGDVVRTASGRRQRVWRAL